MTLVRLHKSLFAQIAAMAMLMHVLAGAICPHARSTSDGARMYDAVLGWVTLCLATPSTSATKTSVALVGHHNKTSGGASACQSLCAAALGSLALVVATFLAPLLIPQTRLVLVPVRVSRPPLRRYRGSISSRGPPL